MLTAACAGHSDVYRVALAHQLLNPAGVDWGAQDKPWRLGAFNQPDNAPIATGLGPLTPVTQLLRCIQLHLGDYTLEELAHYLCQIVQGIQDERRLPAFVDYNEYVSQVVMKQKKDKGCIEATCMVAMAGDQQAKPAGEIRAGDSVLTSDGSSCRVVCTIEYQVYDYIDMCTVGSTGCTLTPEHPICLPNSKDWLQPASICGTRYRYVEKLCNFVLEPEHHAVLVDGVACITLGHCLEDPAVKHDVWGGQGIRTALSSYLGFPDIVFDSVSGSEAAMRSLIAQSALQANDS